LASPRRLPCHLHRRKQEPDERSDDRDHDQEFDERETPPLWPPSPDTFPRHGILHAKDGHKTPLDKHATRFEDLPTAVAAGMKYQI
jgi:hypothetical protein